MNTKTMLREFHRRLGYLDATPTARDMHQALGQSVLEQLRPDWSRMQRERAGSKQACYLSAEFLLGRLVYNNLLGLGILEEVRRDFSNKGLDFAALEEAPDPALGNGGLGRLAACYLDSAATTGIPLDGYGIRYRYGLFRQRLEEGVQGEEADDWTAWGDPWSVRREDAAVTVEFADGAVRAVPYDLPVIGYGGGMGRLRLWQGEAATSFDFAAYAKKGFPAAFAGDRAARELSALLYPDDTLRAGKVLRLKQQYFFSSASLQDMLRAYGQREMAGFAGAYAVQLNDTHPVVAIPEFIRLMLGRGMSFEDAFRLAGQVFSYTNHTIMPEALETWSLALMRGVIPEVLEVVRQIQQRLEAELVERGVPRREWRHYSVVYGGLVHMARLAVYTCHHTNGVSQIHTEILKESVLAPWHTLYPQRLVNVTNGVTPRRWLALCNPELSGFITGLLGDGGWITDLPRLQELRPFAADAEVVRQFAAIKRRKKEDFSNWLVAAHGISLDHRMVFDVQVKRLHEYKRQLLNALSILDLYYSIKEGSLKGFVPTAFLFGGKAAPGYVRAKAIIRFIGRVAEKVNSDPATRELMQVVFVPDYNVSVAERLIPAAELSQQISTAGTEASGTGNMKLSLNGALTIGTRDGANIEIFRDAGEENNYPFGATVEELAALQDYTPAKLCATNRRLRRVVDTLADGTFGKDPDFVELHEALLKGASWHKPDHYYLLLDFEAYRAARLAANADYRQPDAFFRKGLLNTAGCGAFSSDRSVREYASGIWGVEPAEK